MKKALFILAISAFSFGILSNNTLLPKNDLIESTELENTKLQKVNIRKTNSVTEFQTSKIYTQVDTSGTYLRFATAIKGEVNSIKYIRTIEGYTSSKDGFEVTTLYKGISNGEEVSFYNGRTLFDEKITGTNDYYWACYTIKFNTDTYKNANIDVKLMVNGKKVASTNTSLNNQINYSKPELSLGEQYKNNLGRLSYDINSYAEIGGNCVQDSLVIGNNIYYSICNAGGTKGSLVKASFNNQLKVEKTKEIKQFSKNIDWCSYETLGNLSYYDNTLYLMIPNSNKETKEISATFNSYDLDLNLIKEDCTIPVSIENEIVTSFAYNDENKTWAVASTSDLSATKTKITILDKNKETITSYTSTTSNNCKYQSMFMDNKYVYTVFGANETTIAEIKMFDYINNVTRTLLLKSDNMVLNDKTGVQSVSYCKDNLYIFARDWSAPKSFIYKASIKDNNNSNITFAEKLDLSAKKGQEFNYEINNPMKIEGAGLNTQSAISDGKYVYYGITFTANKNVKILRYDLEKCENKISASIPTTSGNTGLDTYQTAGNICLAKDIIYVTTADLGLKAFNKNALEEVECNLSFDSTKVITSLTYNEELDLFAVTYSEDNGIYFYNNNQELQYSVDGSLINANGLSFQTLNSDNNYIYASFSTDRTFAISINVIDWKGNVIGNKYINTNANDYTGVKLGLGEQSVAQTIVDINGKSYILVLQWGASSKDANDTGAYLYPVKL